MCVAEKPSDLPARMEGHNHAHLSVYLHTRKEKASCLQDILFPVSVTVRGAGILVAI